MILKLIFILDKGLWPKYWDRVNMWGQYFQMLDWCGVLGVSRNYTDDQIVWYVATRRRHCYEIFSKQCLCDLQETWVGLARLETFPAWQVNKFQNYQNTATTGSVQTITGKCIWRCQQTTMRKFVLSYARHIFKL